MSLREEVNKISREAQALGVARYLDEHPDANVSDRWVDAEVERWRGRPVDEIAAEARRLLDRLDELPMDESVRVDVLNAQLNLHNIESGAFKGAAGGLYDFLREAGADVSSFDIG